METGPGSTGSGQALDEARLTMVGLLFETAAGLRRVFEPRLESGSSLSNQSFDVLIRLARSPENRLRMSELAAQTTLTPSGLTRSVDRLEVAGLVVREVCPEDRRGAFAVLTASGRLLMAKAVPDHLSHMDEVFGDVLTDEEERMLSALLRKLRDHLYDTHRGCGDGPDPSDICPSTGGGAAVLDSTGHTGQ